MIAGILACTLVSALPAAEDGVRFFEGTYSEALARASSKKVPLYIDFYTDW